MSREAMELALEALESDPITHAGLVSRKQAITALRQALVDADDTSQKRVDEMVKIEHDKQIEIAQAYERGWNAALAQQEPVAWLKTWSDGSVSVLKTKSHAFADHELEPLYTAPPKREWVGLHGSEVPDAYKYDVMFMEGWLWAEERLKEKNT